MRFASKTGARGDDAERTRIVAEMGRDVLRGREGETTHLPIARMGA
jgi:hypothetical protein